MNKLVPVEIVYIKKTSRSFYCIILPNFPLFFYFLNLVGRVRRPLRRQPEKPFHPCLHHTITTLEHHCRMCLPGSSPSGQKANRTKRLWWPKKRKNVLTVTSLESCCCYVDRGIHIQCFLEDFSFRGLHIEYVFTVIVH